MQQPPQVGPYQLTRQIGQGSFGAVYQAVHSGTQATVALKVLRDPSQVEEEDFKRFWLEGQLGLRLRHPAIVPVLDVGRAPNGLPYLAMEYVEGPTLAARLRQRRLDVEEATRLLVTLARGVSEIHAAGVLHRDLKPSNVILDDAQNGAPRITDFGLARDPTLIRSLTQTGERLGTPAYMAPEQAAARKGLDPRVDVYALGVIYFECLTGTLPHQAGTVLALFDQIVRVPSPPPSSRCPGLPASADAICARALALDPNDRYLDCAALAADLEALLEGDPKGENARPASSSNKSTLLATGALALLLGTLATGGAVALGLTNPTSDLARSSPPPTPSPEARSLFGAVREIEGLRTSDPGRAAELARSWNQPASERLEAEAPLEAREIAQLVSLLQLAGIDPTTGTSAAVRRWLLARDETSVDLADREILHELCEAHLDQAQVSALDLWFAESLLGRGRFDEVELSIRDHEHHLRGEARLRAKLAFAQSASGKRTGWSLTPTLLAELIKNTPGPSVAVSTAKALLLTRQARYLRGDRQQEAKLLDRALEQAESAVRSDPDYLPAQLALAGVLTRLRSPEAASAWARALLLGPKNVLVPMARERAFRRDDSARDAARERFLELTVGTKSYPRAKHLLRRGWRRVLEKDEGAKADLEECLALRPFELRIHFGLGLIALRAGDRVTAKERLSLALAMPAEHRGRGEGWEAPALILRRLAPDERERIQALSVEPEPSPFLTSLDEDQKSKLFPAVALSMNSGQEHEVQALFKENLAAAKRDPACALILARLCVGRDMFDVALQAIEACPLSREAELLRGDVARRRGFLQRALRVYERLARGDDDLGALARGEERLLREDWAGAQAAVAPLLEREPALAYRAELIRGTALLRGDPGQAMLCFARAKRIVGNMDLRAPLLQIHALVRLIATGQRAWLPDELMRSVLFLAPGSHSVLQVVEPLLAFLQDQPDPQLMAPVEQMLMTVASEDSPLVHVALGSLRLVQRTPPQEVFEHWKRAIELDPEVRLPPRELKRFSNISPELARELEKLRQP